MGEAAQNQLSEDLSGIPIFADIDAATIAQLTKNFTYREFSKDEQIITQANQPELGYLLLSGRVEVFYASKDNEKTTVIFHEAPWIIGHVELYENLAYVANVRAIEDCATLQFNRADYCTMLESNHQIALNMVKMMSHFVWITSQDRRVRCFGRVEHLLANLLCHFATMYGHRQDHGVILHRPINKSELAEILGIARRSVIRAFEQLEEEKLVYIQDQRLVIPNLIRLQQKARDL